MPPIIQDEPMRISRALLAAVLLFAASPTRVDAHHGRPGHNVKSLSELTGMVDTAPHRAVGHPSMKIIFAGQPWILTLGPLTDHSRLLQAGIPIGATVRVQGYRNRDPKQREIWVERLTWGDRQFDLAPTAAE